MKKLPCLCLAFGLLLFTPRWACAQTQTADLPGYWNLETNLTTHDYTIVRFYNGQDQLVAEQRLPCLCLNLGKGSAHRQKTMRQLTLALQQVLHDPASGDQVAAHLAQQLDQRRRVQRVYAVR